MSDPSLPRSAVQIGAATFDPASGDLTGPAGRSRLAPQPSALLSLLVKRRGELVIRRDVGAHLWPDTSVAVDQGIGFAVREVRKGLAAVGGDPSLIETIPRRGFRLAGEPESVGVARTSADRRRLWLGAVLAVAVLAFGVLGRVGSGVPVIALFPHDVPAGNLSLLASDLSTSLTATLTATFEDRLGVVGPTGTSSLESPDDMAGLQAVLGACLVLSGSISPAANDPSRLVVFTQVVRTSDRVHLWAASDTVPADNAVAQALPRIVAGVRDTLGDC